MKLAALLLFIGVAIICYAASIPPYTDEKLFMERYMALSVGQSEEYWKLRDEMLTAKFRFQDYGGTFIAVAVGLLLVSRRGWRGLNAPKSRSALVLLALAAPVLTIGAYVYDLSLGFVRGEFPHWADSMSIPLMGTPVLLAILLAWSAAHLAFLRGVYRPMPLYVAISRKANWWLLFVAALSQMMFGLFRKKKSVDECMVEAHVETHAIFTELTIIETLAYMHRLVLEGQAWKKPPTSLRACLR